MDSATINKLIDAIPIILTSLGTLFAAIRSQQANKKIEENTKITKDIQDNKPDFNEMNNKLGEVLKDMAESNAAQIARIMEDITSANQIHTKRLIDKAVAEALSVKPIVTLSEPLPITEVANDDGVDRPGTDSPVGS